MKNAQEIYNRIQEVKLKIKDIKTMLKEQYEEIPQYVDLQAKIKSLRTDLKQITLSADDKNPDLIIKLDDLKIDLSSDKELLSDIVLTSIMQGKNIELTNKYEQSVLPIFSVIMKPNK